MKPAPKEVSVPRFSGLEVSVFTSIFVALLTAGCNESGGDTAARRSGSATVVVSALSARAVARATLSITAADMTVPITATLAWSNGWQVTIDGIPAGTGRTFALAAMDANGAEKYRGETADVTITPGETQSVVIVAQQTSPSVQWNDSVPVIDVAQSSASTVAPGGVVSLKVTAHDPDPNDTLTFAWTAGTGTLARPTAQSTTWTAPSAEGTYPITVAVRDAQNEVTTTSLQITVAPTPAPEVSVPIPPHALWLLGGLLAVVGSILAHKERKRG